MKRSWMLLTVLSLIQLAEAQAAGVIELNQTACRIVNVQHYQTDLADTCRILDEQTAIQRSQESDVLRINQGEYIFRSSNRDAGYMLGAWLRVTNLSRLTLPSVLGGSLHT